MLKDGSVSGLGTPYMNNRWDDAQRYVAASQCTLNDAEEKNVFLPVSLDNMLLFLTVSC